MKTITSIQNPLIKQIAQLKTKKGRAAQNLFIMEGIRSCFAAIQTGHAPKYLFATEKNINQISSWYNPDDIIVINENILKKISAAKTPSGVIGVFNIPVQPKPELLGPGIVLINISDPGNMGTLIRSAVAFGKHSIVVIGGVDPWSPKVIQSSAGSILKTQIFIWNWQTLLQHKKDLNLIALVASGGKTPKTLNLKNTLLAIGSEAHGIPQDWLNDCDQLLTLPMPGGTESLNAAIAGSIALYETI